ncbi:DMT family transporter [Sphingomonas oligoaromativorans]|uniref:DMT family transporter n=1 Tax=Sphingomonas oligoaromativorans TaxID=575322 RepID=UPI001ABAA28B|nr:DMT family transporter [Sphingomonas oligoaromativorans]NIJ32934.1 drug/metabolite transporter (DMT)-like permease [Sphingomonas oligoaromativorans]
MAHQPDPPTPIFEEEILSPDTAKAATAGASPLAFVALIVGNVVLAIGPWFVRMADVGPVASGFWRLALAVPFLLLIARASGQRFGRMPGKLWAATLVAGVFFAGDLSSWHAGILHTKLANATLLGNISSFFFAAYGFIIARTLPGRWQVVAMALAASGTVMLLGRSYHLSPDHLLGDLLCLIAGLAYTGYMIAIDRARSRLGTWPTLSLATIVSSALLLPAALLIDGSIWPQHWGPLVALAIGSQVIGQGLLVYAIGTLSPVVVGLVLLCQPVVAAAIGWAAYGEKLGTLDLVGALAIAASLVLVRRGRAS